MNISYKWLKQYIGTDVPAEELSKILTSIGLEVGAVEEVQSIKGGLDGLVIGEVLSCDAHENSDHLHVTQVNVGGDAPLQIVCGAVNVAAGQKVVVATIGTKLYSGDESFMIKRSKIRGVESFGMICAEDEIGLGTSHEGIMVLPAEANVGTPAKEYFGIENDTLIEVDITPNRVDAASHYGVARDLAAYFMARQEDVVLSRPSVDEFTAGQGAGRISVKVEESELAPRYAGVTIKGVKIEASPKWLQERLQIIGLRPINSVVDITNYVLHAFGQPLHAFDVAKIKGNTIEVKRATAGTKFVTLDGVEHTLDADDLMICNAEEPMCIAGVFGGLDAGVTETTTDVFLESAYFNPVSVRKTARRHGLNTDSSFRFERGIDPNGVIYALKYAALLIEEIAGGKIDGEVIDLYPEPIANFPVTLSLNKVNRLIGKELTAKDVERILKGLEIETVSKKDDVYQLVVPAYRVDVQRDVDVIEDILRIYGYNNIELSDKLNSNISYSTQPDSHKLQQLVSEQLTAQGFNEILNNSLTKGAYYDLTADAYASEHCVSIMNALSLDLNVMRQTLLFGGLESIRRNANRQNSDLKFYEFGNSYRFDADKKSEDNPLSAYSEQYRVALWVTGKKSGMSWNTPESMSSFYDLKGYVEQVLVRLGVKLQRLQMEEFSNSIYHQGLRLLTAGGKEVGTLGIVSSTLLKAFDLDAPVYYAELNWDILLKENKKHKISYTELSKYPEVKRDLALLVDKSVTFADIEKIAYAVDRKLLKRVTLFDVYEGKNLEPGKKSYAVSFTLQDTEKTLTDKQIDAIMQKLIKSYSEKLGAKLR